MITENTIKFLIENKINDSKAYFLANKERYENDVLTPVRKLVVALAPAMLKIDADFIVEPKVSKTISRIYRDTRFSKDKSLYRDVVWVCFQRKRNLFEGESSYFFEFSPRGFRYGLGYYEAGTEAMEIMRKLIDNNDKTFIAALKAYKAQNSFHIEGDLYKKSRYKGSDEVAREFYDRRSIFLCNNEVDSDLLFSDNLAETLYKEFDKIKQVYYFFRELEKYKAAK